MQIHLYPLLLRYALLRFFSTKYYRFSSSMHLWSMQVWVARVDNCSLWILAIVSRSCEKCCYIASDGVASYITSKKTLNLYFTDMLWYYKTTVGRMQYSHTHYPFDLRGENICNASLVILPAYHNLSCAAYIQKSWTFSI